MVIVVNLENLNFKLFGKWHVSIERKPHPEILCLIAGGF